MRASFPPVLRILASVLLAASAAAPAATLLPQGGAAPVAHPHPAQEPEARPSIAFTRGLPQPPMRHVAQDAAPAPTIAGMDVGPPHPRPRAFRGACNSTTGC